MREDRERTEFYRKITGDGAAAEAIRQATTQQQLLRSIDMAAPYIRAMDIIKRDRKEREAFKKLTSTAWALSVTDTARGFAERHAGLIKEQRQFSSSLLDTVTAFEANKSVVGAAIAAASAGDRYKRMITDVLPRMSMFGAMAERMLMVDAMTLRAGEDVPQSATAIAANMVIEAHRIAEAIVEAPTDDESVRLYNSLLDVFVKFVTSLGPNTIPELQRMGLVGFIGFVITVLSLYTLFPQEATQSPEDKAALAQLNDKVDRLQKEERHYHEAEAQREEDYLANLPRAEISRPATFRRKPGRDGEVVLRAPQGMGVAIAQVQGRWRLVIYRDPLSNQLAQAWVYLTAVAPLAHPLPADEG